MTRIVEAARSLGAAVILAYTTLDRTWWIDDGRALGLLDLTPGQGRTWAKLAWGAGLVAASALVASAFIPRLAGFTRIGVWFAVAATLTAVLAAPDDLVLGVAFPCFLAGCAIGLAGARPQASFLEEPLETLREDGPYVDGERHGRWMVYQGDDLIRVDVYERGMRTSSLPVGEPERLVRR